MTNRVLEDVRVVDWTTAYAGPKGIVWLAALGAEVTHVEWLKQAQSSRTGSVALLGLQGMSTKRAGERNILYENANYNKKSISVDLTHEKGKEIIYHLVEKSDVFATNQLPDTIENLGMDYETLSKYNPKLIYCTNSIVGYKGPYRVTPGHDSLGQVVSGLVATTGWRGERPVLATRGFGDLTSGFAMCCGVVTALLYRQRTGKGQRVDTSQMQSLMNTPISIILAIYSTLSEEERRASPYNGICQANPRNEEPNPGLNYYCCQDGRWLQVAATQQEHWVRLARALGQPDLLGDPRLADDNKRAENHKELIRVLDEIFAQRPLSEWCERLESEQVPFYPVNGLPNLLQDPQVLANDMLQTFEHPQLGTITLPGMPFHLSKTPGKITKPAAEFAENTEEVLLALGYSWEDILQLRETGVILA